VPPPSAPAAAAPAPLPPSPPVAVAPAPEPPKVIALAPPAPAPSARPIVAPAPAPEPPKVVALVPPTPEPVAPRAAPAALPAAADSPELRQLMTRGDEMLRLGDPASARLFYERAAGRGLSRAYTAVGRTYDPTVLLRLGIRGGGASGEQALAWYRRGAEAGDADAARAADDLTAWLARPR
jgi:hypothetical protein